MSIKDRNEHLNELRKTIQDTKDYFNEELEGMERNEAENLEMQVSIESLWQWQGKSEGYQDLKGRLM